MYAVQNYIRENRIRVHSIYFEKLEGVTMQRGDKVHICVSDQLDDIRRIEVLAHEIGHIEDGTVDSFITALGERRAERIGRSILIPYEQMREIIEDLGECDLSILSRMFGVSYETMERRFYDLFPQHV